MSSIGLLVSVEVEKRSRWHVESASPRRDGEHLPGAGTVVGLTARADESGAGRLGTTIVEIGASSQDNLVISCCVVHPCARLRMCRREAPAQPAATPIPLARPASAAGAIEATSLPRIGCPAAG